ncbi:MAG: NHL repeat-containing protein, partial [Elusimicrobia bacterium]|nr:NHL repeat-containing protein [Elusimicrobiota bacterium]
MDYLALLKRLAPLGFLLLMAPWRADAVISDGMNAENILGQLDDSDNPVWNTNVPNYRPNAQGFNIPTDVAIDTSTHRLFVTDYSNNRVLVFDLDSSNNLVDRTADHVLGQPNFSGFQYQTTQNGMYNPIGLAYDPGGQRLFVSDYNNHRVLVFNISTLSDGQQADYVLGQTDFTSRSSAASQTKMNLPMKLFYDGTTHRLYVPELSNNRVLVFNVSSITNGQAASYVLGQPNFTSNTASTSQNGLNTPRSVELSTTTQKLFVADYGNNRVMVYDASSLSNGLNASSVIGQSNFTTNTSATSQTGLNNPYGLAYDPGSDRLFVSDYSNHRVMVFDGTTNTNNPTALNVLGQANYTNGTYGTSRTRLFYPRGLAMDSGNKRLYVADGLNYRVVFHDVNSIVNGQNAEGGFGLQDGSGADSWTSYLMNAPPNDRGFVTPYGVSLDSSTHRLFVSDTRNNRVLVFDLDANDTIVDRVADYVLGQTDFNNAVPATTQNRLNFPIGLAYDPIGKRLFVGDMLNGRIMVYDLSGGITNGQNASNVLGQLNFTTAGAGSGQNKFNALRGLAYDPLTHRLYVADYSNNRVLVFNVSTITDGMNASAVLGQPDFATISAGVTQSKMSGPYGVALDIAGQRLFVSDYSNKRVLDFDVSSLSNGQAATHVLGQPNFTSNAASTSQNGMSGPYGGAYDSISGRLYVSDHTNNRI